MTDTTKAQILDLARKAINTEMLALKHMKETLGDNFADAVELILACSGKCIVTGMGKSGLVGRKIAATLASTGTPSFFLHPGEAFHGDLGMISKDDVVLALSYSGETDEILKIVPFIHSNGNKLVSMTGNPESALAKNSDIHLDVSVEEEACILHLAPTTSTTAQIAMGDAQGRAGAHHHLRRREDRGHRDRRRRAPCDGAPPRRVFQYQGRRYRHAQPENHLRG